MNTINKNRIVNNTIVRFAILSIKFEWSAVNIIIIIIMYSMDNLERDMMNRQYIYEAHSFLGNPAIPTLPPHCGVPTTATLPAVIPSQLPSSHHPSGSTGSTSGSEHYLYDENSSDESVYSSDQENHAREWVSRKCLAEDVSSLASWIFRQFQKSEIWFLNFEF